VIVLGVLRLGHEYEAYARDTVATMKFSVWPDPSRPTSEVLELARFADEGGWHGFWYADHYMPNTGSEAIQAGDVHECWAVLPAVAAVTEHIRLGPLVAPTSVHHPAVLANRAATIDHLSGGRMVLGLGAGWQINEHHAYGIELQEPGPRVTRFDEAIQIVRSLLSEERTSFDGEYYSITDAPSDPKPVQSPLPIVVGTASPRMLRITARHADEWNAWGAPALAAESMEKLHVACEAVDRDAGSLWKSTQALVFLTDDTQLAEKVREGQMGTRTISGTADQIVAAMNEYIESGFDEFILPDFTFGSDPAERHDRLTEFKATVADRIS
jgi:probable F420-dependent oxidoreductase